MFRVSENEMLKTDVVDLVVSLEVKLRMTIMWTIYVL